MAYFLRYLIVIAGVVLGFAGVLRAQAERDPGAEVEITFTVFAPRAVKGIGYFPEGEKGALKGLKFYNSYRSPVMSYRGGSVLRFYEEGAVLAVREAATPLTSGKSVAATLPPPIALCAIPEGVEKAFLLFIPRASPAIGGLKFDIYVMNDGEASIPREHFVIINASKLELLARINGKDTKISRGVSAPIRAEKGLVILAAVREEPEYHKLMISDTWSLGPRQRNLLIFFPPRTATALLPDVVRLNDEMPEPAQAAER